jgi:beta-barrel assembly-enhancing protease
MIRILLLLICLIVTVPAPVTAQTQKLPGFGEGNAVSLNQEYYLGRAWLMSFRRQAPILDDALMQDYVENLIYRLAVSSELRERRLEVVLVENKSINAFAVPGGVVGVHTGLIAKAETEAQFTSVLTHELAHLSQRHFSRGIEARKKSSAAMMAGLLGGLVAIAAGAGDAGMAAIMGGQAAAMDSQLRYSRQHEQEADRVGMQNQVNAGLDPGGAAGMFEVMQADSRNYGTRPPEFLLTHPLTGSRIADARNRAATFPKRIYEDNPEFQLMRARVDASFFENSDEAVAHFREQRAKGGKHVIAAQYGLILALTQNGGFAEARELLRPMREFRPYSIVYLSAEIEIDIAQGKYDTAVGKLENALELSPGNNPMTKLLGKAYAMDGDYAKADALLSRHVRKHSSDANLWYQLAEIQGKAGNILGLHQSRAEYFALNGAMTQAIEQLNFALPKANNNVTVERIHTRIAYFQNIQRALKQLG